MLSLTKKSGLVHHSTFDGEIVLFYLLLLFPLRLSQVWSDQNFELLTVGSWEENKHNPNYLWHSAELEKVRRTSSVHVKYSVRVMCKT